MRISDFLNPASIRCHAHSTSKKRVLETLSQLLAAQDPKVSQNAVFDALVARERLGSTGLGDGVALPHARFPNLGETVGAFVKLEAGIDFDANDGQPVDLVFGLLVPEESTDEHLSVLSKLAETFRDDAVREQIRASDSIHEIWTILTIETE